MCVYIYMYTNSVQTFQTSTNQIRQSNDIPRRRYKNALRAYVRAFYSRTTTTTTSDTVHASKLYTFARYCFVSFCFVHMRNSPDLYIIYTYKVLAVDYTVLSYRFGRFRPVVLLSRTRSSDMRVVLLLWPESVSSSHADIRFVRITDCTRNAARGQCRI